MSTGNSGAATERERDGRSRRQSKEETRRELLSTAHDMLLEQGLPAGINLRLTDVLERKGLTTGAAYHIWESQRHFQEELMAYIAEQFDFARSTGTTAESDDAMAELTEWVARDPIGATKGYAESYFEQFRRQREFYLALQLWGIHAPSTRVTQAVQRGYDAVHDGLVVLLEGALAAQGRQVKEGFTIDDATVLVTAVTEGLALRQRFDQSVLRTDEGHYLYSEAMMAFLEYFTEPADARAGAHGGRVEHGEGGAEESGGNGAGG